MQRNGLRVRRPVNEDFKMQGMNIFFFEQVRVFWVKLLEELLFIP